MSEAADPEPLQRALGYEFRDHSLLETALSHPSWSHEADGSRGNERLEYLGDAVLDLALAHLLYAAHPDWNEGDLTRTRAAAVNQRALAARARELDLGRFLKLGRTEQRTEGAGKDSVLANACEALFGALYLDAGLARVVEIVERVFGASIHQAPRRDAKTELQEWAHATRQRTPSYRTVDDTGTEDDDRRFTVEVRIGAEALGRGVGRSKRAAERAAARDALSRQESQVIPESPEQVESRD